MIDRPRIDDRFDPGGLPSPRPHHAAGLLGMALFLASLAMFFAAGIVGYLIMYFTLDGWPPPDAPGLPSGLWVSTGLLVAASVALHAAQAAAVRGDRPRLRFRMALALAVSLAFLLVQWPALHDLLESHAAAVGRFGVGLYGLIFFLIVLHALHVIGGLIPMAIVLRGAFIEPLTVGRARGVALVAAYWHFLGVVWLVLFFALLFTVG